jgi:hypothetical protein
MLIRQRSADGESARLDSNQGPLVCEAAGRSGADDPFDRCLSRFATDLRSRATPCSKVQTGAFGPTNGPTGEAEEGVSPRVGPRRPRELRSHA